MLMLRYRSRSMSSSSSSSSSKHQPKMADHGNLTSPKQDRTVPISPFSYSSSFFSGLIKKSENESYLSPTSILDSKPMNCFGTPIWHDNLISPKSLAAKTFPRIQRESLGSRDVGLAVIGSSNVESSQHNCDKPGTRLVLFASSLKVQIPSVSPSHINSPKPPSRSNTRDSRPFESPKVASIFDSLNVEERCGDNANSINQMKKKLQKEMSYSFSGQSSKTTTTGFLSFCYTCKKKLGQGRDIYIYKGEKAFCSKACRCEEMALDADMSYELGRC